MAGRKLADDVPRIHGRHAFSNERVLVLIAFGTAGGSARGPVPAADNADGLVMAKADMAKMLGVCEQSINRSISKLVKLKHVERVPRAGDTGASLANLYRATPDGVREASRLMAAMLGTGDS